MKKLLASCAVGVAVALTMTACDRAKPPVPAAAPAAFQKIDTVTGTGKEAVAGTTARVQYNGRL